LFTYLFCYRKMSRVVLLYRVVFFFKFPGKVVLALVPWNVQHIVHLFSRQRYKSYIELLCLFFSLAPPFFDRLSCWHNGSLAAGLYRVHRPAALHCQVYSSQNWPCLFFNACLMALAALSPSMAPLFRREK
jgi:hypothetical protein